MGFNRVSMGVWRSGCAALAVLCPAAATAETPAGTAIPNTASMRYTVGSQDSTVQSNTVTLALAERLDVAVTAERDQVAVTAADNSLALGFMVTNRGNGQEAFTLTAVSPDAAVKSLYLDRDGDGRFSSDTDQLLTDGALPAMAPGAALRVFVVVDASTPGTQDTVTLTATAVTGSGQPGTVFAGKGDGGGDAVVGATGAQASARTLLVTGTAQPMLTKSQSVRAPDGGATPVAGAVITYTLVASFPGAVTGVAVDDPIPAGTTYVPGSLTLDGQPLTDAADGDAGLIDASGVHVTLGPAAPPASRSIQFRVIIQ